jgi:hypothetical protein
LLKFASLKRIMPFTPIIRQAVITTTTSKPTNRGAAVQRASLTL